MANTLLPKAGEYWKNGFNVLLIGPHGVGKTVLVKDLANEQGINVKYFSCSTLEPFTHFVGVPHPSIDTLGRDTIKLLRPRDVDDAEMLFFDELNRADDTVLNAVLEIVQFGTINGEPLPKLRCVWAAINPPEGEYHVHELDPALVDRFDIYEELKPKPNAKYLEGKIWEAVQKSDSSTTYVSTQAIAKALVQWFNEHDFPKDSPENYVSPRRLEKIGTVIAVLHSAAQVRKLLPPGSQLDAAKLQDMLTKALKTEDAVRIVNNEGAAVFGPNSTITYKPDWIFKNLDTVVEAFQSPDCAEETRQQVVDAMAGAGAERWCIVMDRLLREGLDPKTVAAAYFSFPDTKQDEVGRLDIAKADSPLDQAIWSL